MHMGRNGVVDEVHIMHMGFYLYINFIPECSTPRHYLQRIVVELLLCSFVIASSFFLFQLNP